MHYQEKIDNLFKKGGLWKHRTLRTLFDPNSSEYSETTLKEKIEILKAIRNNEIDVKKLLLEYKEFYLEENKIHVVNIADKGLEILIKKESIFDSGKKTN